MTHVSKKKLHSGATYEIVDVFAKTLCKLRGKEGERFLGELFTRTEVVMLSKRLAMILLIEAGYTDWTIRTRLSASMSTVQRIRRASNAGSFRYIQGMQKRKREREALWDFVEKVARGGLPPRGARWKKAQPFRSPYKKLVH